MPSLRINAGALLLLCLLAVHSAVAIKDAVVLASPDATHVADFVPWTNAGHVIKIIENLAHVTVDVFYWTKPAPDLSSYGQIYLVGHGDVGECESMSAQDVDDFLKDAKVGATTTLVYFTSCYASCTSDSCRDSLVTQVKQKLTARGVTTTDVGGANGLSVVIPSQSGSRTFSDNFNVIDQNKWDGSGMGGETQDLILDKTPSGKSKTYRNLFKDTVKSSIKSHPNDPKSIALAVVSDTDVLAFYQEYHTTFSAKKFYVTDHTAFSFKFRQLRQAAMQAARPSKRTEEPFLNIE